MSTRRLLSLVLLNIIVSAAVVLAILWWWDGRNKAADSVLEATRAAPAVQTFGTITLPTTEAIAVATAVTTQEPKGPPTHIVKPGDTLGKISELYGVSMADIMEMNGITDPNVLSVGDSLLIPVDGIPTATAVVAVVEATAVEATNTPLPPIPTIEGVDGIIILEIRKVTGVGELDTETVQIINSGNHEIDLRNWQLADQNGHYYTFGQVTLYGEGAGIQIHSATGTNTVGDLFWGEAASVWQAGETATLLDPDGTVQVEYVIP